MNKHLLYLLGGLILGIFLTLTLTKSGNQDTPHMQTMNEDKPSTSMMGSHGMNMSMTEMSEALENLSGDDFDKAFTEMMIDHHQGAIDMAEIAESRAKHQEIKDLSKEIIKAQTKEITDMRNWQNMWNY